MTFDLPCHRCGACCRWPGEVRLSDEEIARLAAFLGLAEPVFIEQHTRLRRDRRGLALKERGDHSCIFLQASACAVNAVKPAQCREFPNRWLNLLWGQLPLETLRRDYPMLFACSAFQNFLRSHPK